MMTRASTMKRLFYLQKCVLPSWRYDVTPETVTGEARSDASSENGAIDAPR